MMQAGAGQRASRLPARPQSGGNKNAQLTTLGQLPFQGQHLLLVLRVCFVLPHVSATRAHVFLPGIATPTPEDLRLHLFIKAVGLLYMSALYTIGLRVRLTKLKT